MSAATIERKREQKAKEERDKFKKEKSRSSNQDIDVSETGFVSEGTETSMRRSSAADMSFPRMDWSGELDPSFEVPRQFLVDKLKWRVDRDDSFCSLPFSVIYLFVFMIVISHKLQVSDRYQVEKGIEDWLRDYGNSLHGPYLKRHVNDLSMMWDWASSSGLGALLGSCTEDDGDARCIIGSRNLLLGDIRVVSVRKDSSERADWLLKSEQAERVLAAKPLAFREAAVARLEHLRPSHLGERPELMELRFEFSTYQERLGMFTISSASARFLSSGPMYAMAHSTAMLASAYTSWTDYLLDSCFLLVMLWPFLQESHQLLSTCHAMGCLVGFMNYLGFWNAIDWLNAVLGFSLTIIWSQILLAMQGDTISKVLVDGKISGSIMRHDSETLGNLRLDLDKLAKMWDLLHVFVVVTVFTIILKFFKGFEANRRLEVVTATLRTAAVDIAHFAIVFFVVFLGFALIGHLLLGADMEVFSSLGRSLNTAWIVIMGDNTWYFESNVNPEFIPSLPKWVKHAWFWAYTYCMVLIVLNMLLAIILDYYAQTRLDVSMSVDSPTLWRQCINYTQRRKETKGHVSLERLFCLLVDKDQPVHDELFVTRRSLQNIPDVTEDQALWIMMWLKAEMDKLQVGTENSEIIQRLKAVQSTSRKVTKQLHELLEQVKASGMRLDDLLEAEDATRNATVL